MGAPAPASAAFGLGETPLRDVRMRDRHEIGLAEKRAGGCKSSGSSSCFRIMAKGTTPIPASGVARRRECARVPRQKQIPPTAVRGSWGKALRKRLRAPTQNRAAPRPKAPNGAVAYAKKLKLFSCIDSGHGLHGHIRVELADQLPGSVHAQDRDAGVHGDDVSVGHVGCYGAAAALIHLAQGGNLPHNAGLLKEGADIAHGLGGGVGGAALSPGAGVFANGHAVVQAGVVPPVAGLGKVGVKGVGYVGGEAESVLEAAIQAGALAVAKIPYKGLKAIRLHAGHAHRADFLFVGQDANRRLGGRAQSQQGSQSGKGADPVVVTVSAQKAPVQTHLPAFARRNDGQLGRHPTS